MKANEINFNKFLSQSDTQFIIPVYQRNYDWNHGQCKQLLADIMEVGTNDKLNAHFIGSIVYVHDDVYSASGINELTVIDGQQRLTTVTIIYVALYVLAKELGKEALVNRINEQFLINKFSEDEGSKLKLRPTDNNDRALKYLLRADSEEEFQEYSRLIENYNFFKNHIKEENHQVVLKGMSKLMFVEISLDREKDDPQRIFESLNSTGLELSQADLIRNYILMGLSRRKQNSIYSKYWEVIERMAKDESSNVNRVSDFIRDFLTIKNKKIPNKKKVYQEFKSNYPVRDYDDLEVVLSEVKTYSKSFNKLINPENESDLEIRRHLGYINRLEINVSYPFLIQVYQDFNGGIINKQEFVDILVIIQSFVWRRWLLGLPTNALNKIFMRLYEDVDKKDYIKSVSRSLMRKTGSMRFPRNNEIFNTLKEKDVYNIKSKNRVYFLERLENHNNNEYVQIEGNPKITIEHIFPQNPELKWKQELSEEEYEEIKSNYLNTIANLTLSGNNGRLGNKIFPDKKVMNKDGGEQGYIFSRLWLNRYLAEKEKWGLDEIEERFDLLADRFIEVWPIIELENENEIDFSEVNIFDAEEPTGKKLAYAIFFDQKLEINKVSDLYREIMTQLFELQPQTFFTTEIGTRISISKNKDDLRQGLQISDTYFIESHLDSKAKFDRIMMALTIFGFEDELTIKYKD